MKYIWEGNGIIERGEKLVSINIPFYNRLDMLSRLIRSIEECTPRWLYELVLIDDGSTDKHTVEYAKSKADIFVQHSENLGIAKSRYDGVEASTCKYNCQFDSDAIVVPRWLETLLTTFESDHSFDTIVKLIERAEKLNWKTSDKPLPIRGGRDVKILAPLSYDRLAQYIYGSQSRTYDYLLISEEVPTCGMLFEKSLVDIIGNFDPDLYNLWSDLDFCRRVSHNTANMPGTPVVALDTRVVLYHHGWTDPILGDTWLEKGQNTRSLDELNIGKNKDKLHKAANIIFERWGIKHDWLGDAWRFGHNCIPSIEGDEK